jgi:Leucine-rich repeat (LRR) protein
VTGYIDKLEHKVLFLNMENEEILSSEIARKLAQLAHINNNLTKLNETEPLPPEFDEILAQRVNFLSDERIVELKNFKTKNFTDCPIQTSEQLQEFKPKYEV